MLVVMTGLPGAGKSMLAEALGIALPATVVSVDPVEAAILRAGVPRSYATGLAAYTVAGAVVECQLRLGHDAIADAVNFADGARQMWQALARGYDTSLKVIEVVCSDITLHQTRLAQRKPTIGDSPAPTWEQIEERRLTYTPWLLDRLVVDSAEDFQAGVSTALRFLTG